MVKKPKRIIYHPACLLFPRMSDAELQDLVDDIKLNGLRNPVILYQGKVLDGRNRLAACKKAKVEPRFVEWDGEGSPLEWVISQNLYRRHLTASQRAVIANDLLPLYEKEAKDRQRRSNSYRGNGRLGHDCTDRNGTGKAAEIAARITKSSARYVATIKSLSKQAPELVDRIRSGELSVPDAQRLHRQQEEVAKAKKAKRKRKACAANEGDMDSVVCGDCCNLIPTLDDLSVNLTLTSPPYAQQRNGHYKGISEAEYPDWTVRWMSQLWDKLADDGSVLIVIRPNVKDGGISDYVLRTRLVLREDGWKECEELIWFKPDAPPLGSNRRPRRTWESILWFSKTGKPYTNLTAFGKQSNRLGFAGSLRFGVGNGSPISNGQRVDLKNGIARCPDVFVAPVGTNDKGIQHPAVFPVSLAEQLIQVFSRNGDLVLDSFCGSGTTGVAARKLGREFVGFDTSKRYIKIALQRLGETNGQGVKA